MISPDKTSIISKKRLLDNLHNKAELINLLSKTFLDNGICFHQARDDADTLIVRTTLDLSVNCPITARAEDTDILVLLVHQCKDYQNPIYLATGSGTYKVQDIRNELTQRQKSDLIFLYSCTGCDTVSSIYGYGKLNLFKKLTSSNFSEIPSKVFNFLRSSEDSITNSGNQVLRYIYSGRMDIPLHVQRYHTFTWCAAKGMIIPERFAAY